MEKLSNGLQQLLNLTLTPAQRRAFEVYYHELVEWNARFNLTAITTWPDVQIRHFLDSLSCLLALDSPAPISLIDVGAGAGFPGLPLKILRPAWRLTLLEATRKKTEFLQHVVARLGLTEVTVLHGRAEALGQDEMHRERYDWALARAIASLPTLLEYLLPLCRVGGGCLAQKSGEVAAELAQAERAISVLGGGEERLLPVDLPGLGETRHLLVINKLTPTPAKYPRRPGMPAKRPL